MAPVTVAITVAIDEKRYSGRAGAGPVTALRGLRACIGPSEFCVVTGPSGCGKTTLLNIIAGLDRDLADMATSFRFGPWRSLRHVVLPQLAPFFLVASRTGLALIWKIVLVVELLGRSDGIGYAIQIFFQLFDVRRLIAYALAFVAVVLAVEWGILQPLERRLTRWRR